jgi:hypothetical protein
VSQRYATREDNRRDCLRIINGALCGCVCGLRVINGVVVTRDCLRLLRFGG